MVTGRSEQWHDTRRGRGVDKETRWTIGRHIQCFGVQGLTQRAGKTDAGYSSIQGLRTETSAQVETTTVTINEHWNMYTENRHAFARQRRPSNNSYQGYIHAFVQSNKKNSSVKPFLLLSPPEFSTQKKNRCKNRTSLASSSKPPHLLGHFFPKPSSSSSPSRRGRPPSSARRRCACRRAS
jgi:hypothetical protein